jgi:hypothetical protein
MRTPLLGLAAVLALTLTACSSDDSDSSADDRDEPATSETSEASNSPSTDLRPADEALAEEAADAAQEGALGEFVELRDGLRVTVTSFEAGGDELGAWLITEARVENTGGEEVSVPEFGIVCEGSAERGGYQADSAMFFGDPLPAQTFEEGPLNLLLPGDGRFGEPVPPCTAPAYVEVSTVGMTEETDVVARFAIPDDVVTALQAG